MRCQSFGIYRQNQQQQFLKMYFPSVNLLHHCYLSCQYLMIKLLCLRTMKILRLMRQELTKDMVGVGGVECDVDGGDVVVGLKGPHDVVVVRWKIRPDDILITFVTSLGTFICNKKSLTKSHNLIMINATVVGGYFVTEFPFFCK